MRNLRFAHKQSEDALKKSIFEVLMKYAFPVSNGLVSKDQSVKYKLIQTLSLSLSLSPLNIYMLFWHGKYTFAFQKYER